MFAHSKRLMKLTQSLTPYLLEYQQQDITSADCGDIIMEPKGFSEPCALVIPIVNFIGMYYHPNSVYYKKMELLKRAARLLSVMLENVHEDGTMDLLETNFHDATAMAFSITPLAYAYRLIQKESEGLNLEKTLSNMLMDFFIKGAQGMRHGGFHTPNHRWVMTAALSLMYNILDNPVYKEEALKFLNEGIDQDDDGEYTERSAAIYDITTNESLIVAAEELNMPKLLDYVARNLKKNFAFLEPDMTMCTINSKRQDFSMRYFPLRHYWTAVYMAHKRKDSFFAYLAEEFLKLMESMSQSLEGYLFTGGKEDVHNPVIQYLLNPDLAQNIKIKKPKWIGEWFFEKNGVVRVRDDNTSLTLVKEREVFLKYQSGKSTLNMKIGSSFFGQGYFCPTSIEKKENGYRLEAQTQEGYTKPLKDAPPTNVWDDLPHDSREDVHTQVQKITVDVVLGAKVDIKVNAKGTDGVPIKIELMLCADGRLDTDSLMIKGAAGSHAILKKGAAHYTVGRDAIRIEGGTFAHWYTSNMRGTVPADKDSFTLYMTGFTPFEHEISLSSNTGHVIENK